MDVFAITLDVVGKLMIAYTAMRVHWRVRQEHRIDKRVFREMRREHIVGILGITLIVTAYLLEITALV
jgi:hypothetical protein